MTQCVGQLTFANLHGKQVIGAFDGGAISSDGGLLLIAQAGLHLELTRKLAAWVRDQRRQAKVRHTVAELIDQHVYQIAD
ncbi:MAG: transposase [Armatimonadetes bacterium]|nr:transposase [Armatimonadota bacterium]